MQPVPKSGNVPETNQDGPHGSDDPCNMPGATFAYVPPGQDNYPQNLDYMPWRMPGCPGGKDSY